MTDAATLLLEIWRAIGRYPEVSEAIERVAPLLADHFPIEFVLIRRLDVAGHSIETVGLGKCRPGPTPRRLRSEVTHEGMQRLLAWCHRRQIARFPRNSTASSPPGLLPDDLSGGALAGPLNSEEGPAGLLLLTAASPQHFRDEHFQLLAQLLDPFTVALKNDRRLRELSTLREAVEADNRSLLTKLDRVDISDSIVGAETGLREVMEHVAQVAPSDAPVLILGETGSGKEVVARAVHSRSRRAHGPFLRVNCGAIPPELIDSELFGHEVGSFSGAVRQRKGWFERADGGTLFLDELGELPPAAQVRLLRVLQDGRIERVGGERSVRVDVRIVAATHRDLEEMIAEGRFRQDLWYRVAVFPIQLPALRERPSDIPALAAHFAFRAAKRLGMPPLVPTPADIGLLVTYAWPGNVRELGAVIERAAILGDGQRLEIARALGSSRESPSQTSAPSDSILDENVNDDTFIPLDTAVTRHIERALERTRGRIEGPHGAASLLRVNPHTLRARMRKLGINWSRFRTPR